MENKNSTTIVILAAAALLVVGGFAALKNHKDRVAPTPTPVAVEEAQAPAEEPAVEDPAPEKKKRAKRDTATAITFENVTSVGQNSQPEEYATTSEVVDYAYEMLDYYRNYTEEEKMQMAQAMSMMQYYMEEVRANAMEYVQALNMEERQQLIDAVSTYQEYISAVQQEFAGIATDEEIAVFGGALQSMQAMNDSLLKAALF